MASSVALRPRRLSVANKLARGLWQAAWLFLFRPTPRPLHAWRRLLLRVFGARMGRSSRVYPSARVWAPWNLEMGEGACISEFVDCYCVDKIRIGAHATVSQYSFLCTASHDYTLESMPLVVAPITIGAWAWVTADVFVGPGVNIGDGAVITSRSSVFSDVAAWKVARGNPAVPVKERVMVGEGAPPIAASPRDRT